jgi:hypothetical protein
MMAHFQSLNWLPVERNLKTVFACDTSNKDCAGHRNYLFCVVY